MLRKGVKGFVEEANSSTVVQGRAPIAPIGRVSGGEIKHIGRARGVGQTPLRSPCSFSRHKGGVQSQRRCVRSFEWF